MVFHSVPSGLGADEGPGGPRKSMRDMFGPQAVDREIRQSISMCWMMLPEGKKSIHAVETEIRRLVDRALKDFKEDAEAFGTEDAK